MGSLKSLAVEAAGMERLPFLGTVGAARFRVVADARPKTSEISDRQIDAGVAAYRRWQESDEWDERLLVRAILAAVGCTEVSRDGSR